jgi:predicted ATPase
VTADNAPVVAQICHDLDGIPLAIELAAARVRMMAPEQICHALHDRFRLLTGGPRTVMPRQQTLEASLDWSHNLLSEHERALLRRLAIFAGGWALEAGLLRPGRAGSGRLDRCVIALIACQRCGLASRGFASHRM